MNAMTWWDHATVSIWSQPIGRALAGPLEGTELKLLASQLTTWANWKQTHPYTLAMTNDVSRLRFNRQGFKPDFVIGIVVADQSKAYYFNDVMEAGVINDSAADFPVLVWATDSDFRTYLRSVDGEVLTFRLEHGDLIDEQTGTIWDARLGLGVRGTLKGKSLQPLPTLTSYDWAWKDFYPQGEIFNP